MNHGQLVLDSELEKYSNPVAGNVCGYCSGSGMCHACGGMGTTGTGVCAICGGARSCSHCGGTGVYMTLKMNTISRLSASYP